MIRRKRDVEKKNDQYMKWTGMDRKSKKIGREVDMEMKENNTKLKKIGQTKQGEG